MNSSKHDSRRTARKGFKPSPTAYGMPRAEWDALPADEKVRIYQEHLAKQPPAARFVGPRRGLGGY
jgi:hypothetical protein